MRRCRWSILALCVVFIVIAEGIHHVGADGAAGAAKSSVARHASHKRLAEKAAAHKAAKAAAAAAPAAPDWNPSSSAHFKPEDSLSFAAVALEVFDLTYADNSQLKGYVGHDVVHLGDFRAVTKFGCITECHDPHFNGVDGILGLGLPAAADPSVPQPLFFAITDMYGGHYVHDKILKPAKFAIFSNDHGAELQLGGMVAESAAATPVYIPSTSNTEYSVQVESLSFGGIELLNFNTKLSVGSVPSIPAILDSGTSCLVIPNSTLGGMLEESPYAKFKAVEEQGLSFYITIAGHLFEIPFRNWWREAVDAACVQPSPEGFDGLLLGDVLFRSVVVEFDLTHSDKPIIGLAPPNPLYTPMQPGENARDGLSLPVIKHTGPGQVTIETGHGAKKHRLDRVPVVVDPGETVYFVNVSIGTPPQTFTVFMDTGSSVLAVFADRLSSKTNIHLPDGDVHIMKALTKKQMTARINSFMPKFRIMPTVSSAHMKKELDAMIPHFKFALQTGVQVWQGDQDVTWLAAACLVMAMALLAVAVVVTRRRRWAATRTAHGAEERGRLSAL